MILEKITHLFVIVPFIALSVFADSGNDHHDRKSRPKPKRVQFGDDDYDRGYRFSNYNCNYKIQEPEAIAPNRFCKAKYPDSSEQVNACMLAIRASRISARLRLESRAVYDGIQSGLRCGFSKGYANSNTYRDRELGRNLSYDLGMEIKEDRRQILKNKVAPKAFSAASSSATSAVFSEFRAATALGREASPSNISTPDISYNGEPEGYLLSGYVQLDKEDIIEQLYSESYVGLDDYIDKIDDLDDWDGSLWKNKLKLSKVLSYPSWSRPKSPRDPYENIWINIIKRKRDRGRLADRNISQTIRDWRSLSSQPIEVVPDPGSQPGDGRGGNRNPSEPPRNGDRRPDRDKNGGDKGREDSVESGQIAVTPSPVLLDSPSAVFEKVFNEVYNNSEFVVYHRILERSLDSSYVVGMEVGDETAKRQAYYSGQKEAYDKMFRDRSIEVYNDVFQSNFSIYANKEYKTLERSVYLEDIKFSMNGENSDGIYTPGESFGFEFSLSNIGGQPSDLKVSGAIGAKNVTSEAKYSIAKTSKGNFTTEAFLTIPKDTIEASKRSAVINVSFNVNEFNRNQRVSVYNEAGMDLGSPNAKIEKLKIYIPVEVVNPSKLVNPEVSILNLYVNGQLFESKNLGQLAPGTRTEDFVFSEDFFEILDKTYSLQLELVYGARRIQFSENMVFKVDKRKTIVAYFDALVNKGDASTPEGVSREAYTKSMFSYLFAEFERELAQYIARAKAIIVDKGHTSGRYIKDIDIWAIKREKPVNSDPSVIADILSSSPYVKSSRDIKKLNGVAKENYSNFGNRLATTFVNFAERIEFEFSEKRDQDRLINSVCSFAAIAESLLGGKTIAGQSGYKIKFRVPSSKQKFECTIY